MADSLSREKRSQNMAAIKSKNTRPEVAVRKFLHSQGFRYRLHRKDLPGKPDIVMSKRKLAIFINGCYWHRHVGCKLAYNPKSNIEFWQKKFSENINRDKKNYNDLISQGWNVLIIWECEIKNESYKQKLLDQLGRE